MSRECWIVIPTTGPPLMSLQPVLEEKFKITVWDKEWSFGDPSDSKYGSPKKVNQYLSACLTSPTMTVVVNGPAQIHSTEREYGLVFKHWQSLAIEQHWCDCPRCGSPIPDEIHVGRDSGALSRYDNKTYVCSQCGTEEALLQFFGKDISPEGEYKWKEQP